MTDRKLRRNMESPLVFVLILATIVFKTGEAELFLILHIFVIMILCAEYLSLQIVTIKESFTYYFNTFNAYVGA